MKRPNVSDKLHLRKPSARDIHPFPPGAMRPPVPGQVRMRGIPLPETMAKSEYFKRI